jgi:hypothetical protein
MDNIRYVKLVTGEELICKVKQAEDIVCDDINYYVLSHCAMILPSPEGGIGLIAWPMLTDKNEVTVRDDHILIAEPIREELANAYNARFGSGIVLANANALDSLNTGV